jgi:phosphoribosylamine--glycine ligase
LPGIDYNRFDSKKKETMRILVIGSGGREHAICTSFSRSPLVSALYCADGNAGISQVAECVPIKPDDIASLAEFASSSSIDLTFVGGETSLALGIVDEFERRGSLIVGPGRAAARLEASKAFAKDFMARHGIPTAEYIVADSADRAVEILENGLLGPTDMPVVIKADGLAAGKGVVIARDRAEAVDACNGMAVLVGCQAADRIVLEECLTGKEISLLMFADGDQFALMPPVRDHKRIGDGDTGPNTGGMGTFTDDGLLSREQTGNIVETIVRPTLLGCIQDGFPFRGILFLGLMMTENGPKVLEYNVRFGDPETQAILVRLKSDLAEICESLLNGTLSRTTIEWRSGSSACVVLASAGYPGKARTGDIIHGLAAAAGRENVSIFHAGTALANDGAYVTSGGRVLGVTATAGDLATALDRAYDAVKEINWEGVQFRQDIGKAT